MTSVFYITCNIPLPAPPPPSLPISMTPQHPPHPASRTDVGHPPPTSPHHQCPPPPAPSLTDVALLDQRLGGALHVLQWSVELLQQASVGHQRRRLGRVARVRSSAGQPYRPHTDCLLDHGQVGGHPVLPHGGGGGYRGVLRYRQSMEYGVWSMDTGGMEIWRGKGNGTSSGMSRIYGYNCGTMYVTKVPALPDTVCTAIVNICRDAPHTGSQPISPEPSRVTNHTSPPRCTTERTLPCATPARH